MTPANRAQNRRVAFKILEAGTDAMKQIALAFGLVVLA